MQNRYKYLACVIGAQRTGKTFFVSQTAENQYTKKGFSVLVYGWSGQDADFQGGAIGEPLTEKQIESLPEAEKKRLKYAEGDFLFTAKDAQNKQTYTTAKGKALVYSLKFFNRDFRGRILRFTTFATSGELLSNFYNNILLYVSLSLVVFDDSKGLLRYGMPAELVNLTLKINHAGEKSLSKAYASKGIDVIFILHGLDQISHSLLPALNYIYLFNTTSTPENSLQNAEVDAQILAAYTELKTAPQYSKKTIVYSPVPNK
jgi:hypothetical protein